MKGKLSNTAWRLAFTIVTSLLVAATVQAAEPFTRDATPAPVAPAVRAAEPTVAPLVAPNAETRFVDAGVACDEGSTSIEISALELAPARVTPVSPTQAAACKPCKGRTWCKCTYNGMPRASCNPCCYVNNIGVMTCLD